MFFQGRYGMDKLNRVLLFAALAIYVISLFFRRTLYPYALMNLAYIALGLTAFLRAFSRNYYKREAELQKYLLFENRLAALWRKPGQWWREMRSKSRGNVIDMKSRRNYKYLYCPQCMQKLRVPRGKGKLLVTCTKCGCRFQTRS